MSQDSILELLSVTNKAVKALDRTSNSRSSGSSGGTPRSGIAGKGNDENRPPANPQEVEQNSKSIADPGVGKTVTKDTKEPRAAWHDSDDSTTASDILIQSTLVDHPTNRPVSLNSSASSQTSRCRELDNFNIADAKKVKVAKKQLREIVSPQDSPDSASQPGYLSGHNKTNLNMNNNNQNNSYKPDNGKVINDSFPGKACPLAEIKDAKQYSDSSKTFKEQRKLLSQGMDGSTSTSSVVYTVERHERDLKGHSLKKQHETEADKTNPDSQQQAFKADSCSQQQTAKTNSSFQQQTAKTNSGFQQQTAKSNLVSQQFSHFPYKVSKHGSTTREQVLVEPEDQAENWDKESISSSQPEIVTVEERIVNVSSQALMLSDLEDSASQGSSVDVVSAANLPRNPQTFPNPRPKSQGAGLRQGALTQGGAMPKVGKGDEIQICKFSLTDKQREVREALYKRSNHSKPVRRVVQPKMVHCGPGSLDGEELNKNNNMDTGEDTANTGGRHMINMDSVTAAVAASAAVAATQPFLKVKQELENKMQDLLAEISRVQKQMGSGAGGGTTDPSDQQKQLSGGSNLRLEQLEQQVKELTERRLQHLETLQSQQMQLQAHLLTISRDMSQQTRHHSASHPQHHPSYFPTTSHYPPAPSKAQYDRGLIERELMRGRLQAEEEKRQKDYDSRWGGPEVVHKPSMLEPVESALDTPNPRSRQPRPAQFGAGRGGLLKEILATEPSPQLNTTFNLDGMPAGRTRKRREERDSPVEKARKLVNDLSNLQEQTADSIWSEAQPKSKLRMTVEEPAPLDYYLKQLRSSKHRSRSSSPSKSEGISGTKASSSNCPRLQVPMPEDKYVEARNVLTSVTTERETLEKNLELMLRSRQDVDIYAMIMAGTEGDRTHAAHIQKMVEKRISSLKEEVKREVAWHLQHDVPPSKSASIQDLGGRSKAASRGSTKPTAVGFGSGAPRMSRYDSGLHKSRSAPDTVGRVGAKAGKSVNVIRAKPAPKKSKIPYEDEGVMTHIYGKAQYQKGRTTVKDPYLHYQNQAKPRTSRLPSPKRAESMISVKSSKIQTESSSANAVAVDGVGTGQMQGGAPRQFYFSPTRGYVPITTSSAPVGGQLVPMAVPLGRPRMDHGLAVGPDQPQSVSVPPTKPVVTAATNVAIVAINADPNQELQERGPVLGKQVLPPVDIDSLSRCSSPGGSDLQIKDPDISRNAGYVHTFHYQREEDDDDEEQDRTLTEAASEDEEEEQQGTGISLPGYHQPTPAPAEPSEILQRALGLHEQQASRPMNRPFSSSSRSRQLREQGEVGWEDRCDELAEDLRRRDVLHNKARDWVEQELMARLLMKMYPMMSDLAAQHVTDPVEAGEGDVADGSESIPDDESLLVGDTIGQRGLQLFIDAGQPVNNALVNALMREVIAEKVGSLLGRRREADSAVDSRAMAAAAESRTRQAGSASGRMMMMDDETDSVMPGRRDDPQQRVPTPQPTPPSTSPVPGYLSSQRAPATPPLTPSPPPLPSRDMFPVKDISSASSAPAAAAMVSAATSITPPIEAEPHLDSEFEVSASLDISEELRALDNKLKEVQALPPASSGAPGLHHDVRTPTPTPPPTPPPAQPPTTTTPPPSPTVPTITPPVDKTPAVEEQVSPKKRESSRSPQPWGNPDSPDLEHNPSFQEHAASELDHSQPRLMSVAVGTETVGMDPPRSPSPQQTMQAEDSSELESPSEPSSITDTLNENISEGQWLVDRSEGQVAGLPLDNEVHRLAVEAVKKVDTSTASTLKDTEDLELEDTEMSRSEGEFLHKGVDLVNPETDPVLAYLIHMQNQPGGYPHQYSLPASHIHQVLSATNQHSEGEISQSNGNGVQGPDKSGMTRKSVGEISEGQLYTSGGSRGAITVVAPKVASPPLQDRDARSRQQGQSDMRARSESPITRRSASAPRSKTPPGTQSRQQQQQYQPVRSGMAPSNSRRPLKSALVRSSEESRQSWNSEQEFDSRVPPTEYGTRTLTPDQMNTEALLQSGTYMTSGRQGSTKKSVEFDLSGTYEMSRRNSYHSDDGFTSTVGSSDRLSASGHSLGLRYSFEDTESERGGARSSSLRVSVTMPSAAESESDVSEIDLSEGTGH